MDHANRRRWWHVPAAALAAAALVTSVAPAHADAARSPDREVSWPASTAVTAPVTSGLGADAPGTAAEARGTDGDAAVGDAAEVTEYWTAERMANAIPADEPDRDLAGRQAGAFSPAESADEPGEPDEPEAPEEPEAPDESDAPTVVAEPVPAVDGPVDPQAESVADFSPTNGKVFFHNQSDGLDYVCSGSAVNSAAGRLVATAGHCVHGGPGGTWHANWVFAPGYDHGPGPSATFPAASYRAFDEWITYGASGRGFNSDVAFVTTQDNEDGETVVEAVGGHGLATGGSTEFAATLFGYPGNLDAGERMWSCRGTTSTQLIDSFAFPSISGCDFGGGSSGGPWLDRYDDASGLGYMRSVTSFGPAGSTAYVSGPYFDERITELYQAADGDWVGEQP